MSARERLIFERIIRRSYNVKQRRYLLANWETDKVQNRLVLPESLDLVPITLQKRWLIILVEEDEKNKQIEVQPKKKTFWQFLLDWIK